MHIQCPHCLNPIEVLEIKPREEIACPSCGSSFQLESDSTAAWTERTGQKLGKFELIDTVGVGAFGTVYKARDPELDRTVAIKVPRAGNLAGRQDRDRFLREARSVAQLRHPFIVTVHDVGEADGLPYLVSDFVDGITLADLLSARRPGFRESAELIAAVADALQFAHDAGVVHRDVKPSNIMLESVGSDRLQPIESPRPAEAGHYQPRLMDFGLAKRDAGEITMTIEGQVLGTPAYMSPEQARGEGHLVDGRSDVYSLGVILYQLFTAELPFRGTQRMLLHQVLHDDPRSPRSLNDRIPRDLETITLKAMAKEPNRRYATARALADDLRRWLKGEPILARPVRRVEKAWRWCRRNPALAASVAAVVLLLLTLAAGSTWAATAFRNLARQEAQARDAAEVARKRTKAFTLAAAKELLSKLETESLARAADAHAQRRPHPSAAAPGAPGSTLSLPKEFAELDKQIEKARLDKDDDKQFSLLLKASNELVDAGYYVEAKATAERMVELAARKESRIPIAHGQLGLARYRLGLNEAAVESYGEALKYYRTYYDKLNRAQARPNLPDAERTQIADFLSHLARLQGVTLMRIGNVHKSTKDFAAAEKAYLQAREVLERHDRKAELVTLLLNLGSLQSNRGQHQDGIATLEKGVSLARELGRADDEASLLVNLGNAQARAGDATGALTSYEAAFKLPAAEKSSELRRHLLANWISELIEADRLNDAVERVGELQKIIRPDQGPDWNFALRLLEACLGRNADAPAGGG